MENKNEKSMTLEEMLGEMLKDAKVVKIPLPAKAEEKTENEQQDKPQQVRPSGTPFISLSIENGYRYRAVFIIPEEAEVVRMPAAVN